jgi:hypothetical protein
MPKTAFQKIIFGIIMAAVMVYGMEVYNAALRNGGLSNSTFIIPLGELLNLSLVVVALETFIGGPLARKLAFRFVDPRKDRPIVTILTVSVFTVSCMCPMMSLVATIAFKGGFNSRIVATWVQTVALNFPMAFCWQILIAGPLVRFVFGKLFARQLALQE